MNNQEYSPNDNQFAHQCFIVPFDYINSNFNKVIYPFMTIKFLKYPPYDVIENDRAKNLFNLTFKWAW
jgi:hypothetical protein